MTQNEVRAKHFKVSLALSSTRLCWKEIYCSLVGILAKVNKIIVSSFLDILPSLS